MNWPCARHRAKLRETFSHEGIAMTPWEIEGREFVNCTCEYGCNCQFNALPDKGHCHAVAGIQIDRGHHGNTQLDDLRIAAIFKWPGPIHEGNGEVIAFVDKNADAQQREALLKIMTGQDTAPFATMFAVYASTVSKMHDPVFTQIDLELDIDGRRGRIFVNDYIETIGEPIRNKVSGQESRAQIVLPEGFEYTVAEIGSASSKTKGPVKIETKNTYGQFARLHLNNNGVVRA
jgi:Uncharacterized conserved protein